MAARAFGPATAGVLLLLWIMIISTVVQLGFRLPSFDLRAFDSEHLGFTIGGYTRILALMTGIEIFANLVPAYSGTAVEKSRKAFRSLMIIMGTTSLTMLIVGPAILDLADPTDSEVSVFTQTMDQLLPGPLSLLGTFVGVAVLLSAAAASALGLQNLFAGLKLRHYVPVPLGRLNRFGVAAAPVWLEVAIVTVCFALLGTNEETYLAIYAAGVFILLSMTGWAAAKRLFRRLRESASASNVGILAGTVLAALLTSLATIVIFVERFTEGAWVYFILLPLLYGAFGYFRRRLGPPTPVEERAGAAVAGGWIGTASETIGGTELSIGGLLVPLDGSALGARVLPLVEDLASRFGSRVILLSVGAGNRRDSEAQAALLRERGVDAEATFAEGPIGRVICDRAQSEDIDLIVMSTRGHSGVKRLLLGSVAAEVVRNGQRPVLLAPAGATFPTPLHIERASVALDGSPNAERVLSWARLMASTFESSLSLVHAVVEAAGEGHRDSMDRYMTELAGAITTEVAETTPHLVLGNPALAILASAREHKADLIMLASHGRGGVEKVLLGSVADELVRRADRLVLVVPVIEERSEIVTLRLTESGE